MTMRPVVHVVEDDPSSRKATARALRTSGHEVELYASADEFLTRMPEGPGCLVLDLELPGASGLDLQERLTAGPNPLPVVFLSGRGDVPKTAQAMKAGAVDFLEKPVSASVLLEAVARALVQDVEARTLRERKRELLSRYETLTPREREVLPRVVTGQLNKQIAFDFGTTEHTVKVHRRRIMEKLGADSVADLVRMAADLGIPVGKLP